MTYIVLLNWNGWEDTNSCIHSIYQNTKEEFRIILLDNDSGDDSVKEINDYLDQKQLEYTYLNENNIESSHDLKEFVFIQNNGNYGFAKGINVGLKYCISQEDCNDIWLLNTDAIVDEYSLSSLKDKLYSSKEIGIVGSVIRYFDTPNLIQTIGGGRFFPLLANGKLFYKNSDISIIDNINFDKEIKKLDYIMGASLLIKKEVLNSIGLFDENFFLYTEELDLCTRAKEKGYSLSVAKKSFIYHKDSASTKDQKGMFYYLINKSNAYYVQKHYGVFISYVAFFNNLFINLTSSSKRKYLIESLKGYIDGYKIR